MSVAMVVAAAPVVASAFSIITVSAAASEYPAALSYLVYAFGYSEVY